MAPHGVSHLLGVLERMRCETQTSIVPAEMGSTTTGGWKSAQGGGSILATMQVLCMEGQNVHHCPVTNLSL